MNTRLLAMQLTTFTILLMVLLSACGDGSSGNPGLGSTSGTFGQGSADPATSSSINEPGNNNVVPGTTNNDDSPPYTGTITVDDYDWFGVTRYLGVSDITLSPLTKKRLFDGSHPRRHPSGRVVYRQPCGERVHRIVVADQTLNSTPITPCSSEIPNSGVSPTNFGLSTLSPDQRYLAVEAIYFHNSNFQAAVLVFDLSEQRLAATWDGTFTPEWLRDGRLLLSSNDGFYKLDNNFDNPQRLPDGLTSRVSNPALHPSEDIIAFEYNQQIWVMNTDGSDAKEAVFAGSRLRYPTWSPDGTSIAYLAVDQDDRYHNNIYFTDLVNGISYTLNLDPIQDPINTSNVVNGPLSWLP